VRCQSSHEPCRLPLRTIADRFGVSKTALIRHKTHLPVHLMRAKETVEKLDAATLLQHLQDLRVETLDVLAAAKEAKDSKTMLAAVARAEAQLRLAAEMLGALQTRLHVQVRVIRSFVDVTDEELQFLVAEAEYIRRLPAPTQG
jgi:hypothetical protein